VIANSVTVSWNAPASTLPLTYSVYRAGSSGSGYALAASGISGTTFTDSYLPGGAAVSYADTASDAVGNESAFSVPASLTTPAAWNLLGPSVGALSLSDAGAGTSVSAAAGSRSGLASVIFAYAPTGSGGWLEIPAPMPM